MSACVHIVVVNWNTGECLRECLASVAAAPAARGIVTAVTVIDNASSDGSADGIGEISLPVELLRNTGNVGFAKGCNQGAAGSTADYLLFLNPDTRLLPDTIAAVTRFMESNEAAGIGVCGAEVLDAAGRPAISCARSPTLRVLFGEMTGLSRVLPQIFPRHQITADELRHSQVVDQVIGAFFFVRRELFARLGGFDERYFLYYEEVDFALRARRQGARSYFLKEARICHVGHVSSSQVGGARLYHSLRSRLLFAYRHWPRWQADVLLGLTVTVELAARLARGAARGRTSDIRTTLEAYRRLVGEVVRSRPRSMNAVTVQPADSATDEASDPTQAVGPARTPRH